MRILMFGWEFPPYISGGLGTACHELTRTLCRHDNEITFVVPKAPGAIPATHVDLVEALPSERSTTGTGKQHVPSPNVVPVDSALRPYLNEREYQALLSALQPIDNGKPRRTSILATPAHYGNNLMDEVERYSGMADELAIQEDYDLIHAHDWMTFLAGIRAKYATGKPLVVHVHSIEYDRSGGRINPGIWAVEKQGMEAADHVIAVSHYTRNLILSHYGIAPSKVSVVHNAVTRSHARTMYHTPHAGGKKTVLFLGRVTAQKGPDFFVEAAAKVLERTQDVVFVMAGSGDMLPRLVERVAELQIGSRFHFTGFLQGHDVERLYAMSDLYVMPSLSEPFGISPLEAMAYDVPVIISKHAGVNEILPQALTVDPWNIDDIANKILAVLTYPALSRDLLRNSRKALKTIRWEVAAERVQMIYNRLVV